MFLVAGEAPPGCFAVVCGSTGRLGSWDPLQAPALQYLERCGLWATQVLLPVGMPIFCKVKPSLWPLACENEAF